MPTDIGTITELRLDSGSLSGRIACSKAMRPVPGQYITATSTDPDEALPAILFPSRLEEDGLRVSAPLPAGWTTGTKLSLRGPLGNGFHMPPTARRVALASLDSSSTRLMPLAIQALAQQAAVALYAPLSPDELPEEVEVLPLDLLPEAPEWADFLAIDVPRAILPDLRACLALAPYQRPACLTRVLVVTAMPCSGLAECGVCAVPTVNGWKLACSDGPVFDFTQIEGG